MGQKEMIEDLQAALKQKEEKIAKLKKQKKKSIKLSPSPRHRKRSKSPSRDKNKKKKAKSDAIMLESIARSKSPEHKKTYSVAVENRLQSELVSKLNKMNAAPTSIKILKQEGNGKKPVFQTPPPPKTKSKRSGSRDRTRKGSYHSSHPISLLTPSSVSVENVRSHSSDSRGNHKKHKKRRHSKERKEKKEKKHKKGKKRQSVIG